MGLLRCGIHHIREPRKLPLVMSVDEIKRLLAVAGTLKARVMFSLGYGCGLRASEVVHLKAKHIDSAQNIIRVEQSKGRKDRNVMLSPELLALLRQWWRARPSRYDAKTPLQERWLFPSRKIAGKPITTRHFKRLFHETANAAGIKKGVTLHTLRHLSHRPPATLPARHLPTRFRTLALFSRRSPEHVVRSMLPAAKNLHKSGCEQVQQTAATAARLRPNCLDVDDRSNLVANC
jgi:integrase